MTALYKKGDAYDPANYRYIVVCTIFIKLYARLLNNRLNTIAEANKLFWDTNFGFTKNRSTADSILVFLRLTEDLAYYYNNGKFKKVIATLVDLRKAFPSLNWEMVKRKSDF